MLKPIEREEVEASPVAVVGIVGAIIVAVIVAIVLRMQFPQPEEATSVQPATLWWILFAGAIVLAPPLVLAGYWFLREEELEPHRGSELAIRVCICATIYAALWGGYALLKAKVFPNAPPEMFHFIFIGPVFLGGGWSCRVRNTRFRIWERRYPLRFLSTDYRFVLLHDRRTGLLEDSGEHSV